MTTRHPLSFATLGLCALFVANRASPGRSNKNAPHPNAARLFMDFLLSEEGQRIYPMNNLQPTRKGITVPWAPTNVKLHVSDPEIGEKASDDQKLFREIFGGK
jgi:ABC-type glycerol-3-phosphate transport system substrate-binding protein